LFRECSEADFPKPSNIGVSGNRTSFPSPQIFDIGEGIGISHKVKIMYMRNKNISWITISFICLMLCYSNRAIAACEGFACCQWLYASYKVCKSIYSSDINKRLFCNGITKEIWQQTDVDCTLPISSLQKFTKRCQQISDSNYQLSLICHVRLAGHRAMFGVRSIPLHQYQQQKKIANCQRGCQEVYSTKTNSEKHDAHYRCLVLKKENCLYSAEYQRNMQKYAINKAQCEKTCIYDYRDKFPQSKDDTNFDLIEPTGIDFIADKNTGCKVWNPRSVPNETITWSGQCVNGIAQGKGTLQWYIDGVEEAKYEGELVDGKHTGKGKFTWASGNFYEGDFVDNKVTGKGKLTWANSRYQGDFVDGKCAGKGKLTWANGNIYEGDFLNDKFHGKGKLTLANGNVYEGNFVNDKFHSKEKLTLANGDVYEGDFVNGERTGKGKITLADGDIYEGYFVNGERTGKGKFTTMFYLYEGDFVNGTFHGKGKITFSNGEAYEGDFVNSTFHGKGKITSNGAVYKGIFENGKLTKQFGIIETRALEALINEGNLSKYTLIDSRYTEEYIEGHIPTAISIPYNAFYEKSYSLPIDKNKLLIFYCHHETCHYSIDSVQKARAAGYTNVVRYATGINGWIASRRPLCYHAKH